MTGAQSSAEKDISGGHWGGISHIVSIMQVERSSAVSLLTTL